MYSIFNHNPAERPDDLFLFYIDILNMFVHWKTVFHVNNINPTSVYNMINFLEQFCWFLVSKIFDSKSALLCAAFIFYAIRIGRIVANEADKI